MYVLCACKCPLLFRFPLVFSHHSIQSCFCLTYQGVNISSQGETIDEVRLEQNESAVRFVSYKIVSINLPVLKEARVFPLCEPVCSPFHVSPLSNMWRSK